jgi:hypothetical protein
MQNAYETVCCRVRHKAGESQEAVDVELCAFLTFILDEEAWREALPGCVVPGEVTRGALWVRV